MDVLASCVLLESLSILMNIYDKPIKIDVCEP